MHPWTFAGRYDGRPGSELPATAIGGWVPGYLNTGTRLSISPIVGEASAMTLQAKKKNMRLVTKGPLCGLIHLALKTRHISAPFLAQNIAQS